MRSTAEKDLKLRPATREDLVAVESLLTANSLPTEGVAQALEGFIVAESDKQLVGVVGIESCCNEYALLRSTAVDAEWRGRGLGRKLLERAIADAESRGIHALYLLTTTAEHYFPSFGFTRTTRDMVPKEVRASSEFTTACPASATVMILPLAAATGQ